MEFGGRKFCIEKIREENIVKEKYIVEKKYKQPKFK
jgi:hypothetical protein